MNKTRYTFLFAIFLLIILLAGFDKVGAVVFSDDQGTNDTTDVIDVGGVGGGGSGTSGSSGSVSGNSSTSGTLTFEPLSVRGGQTFKISLIGGPVNAPTKIWVDNGDGRGFRDFGGWINTNSLGGITEFRTLNCNNYLTLEPNQSLPIGDRKLTQKVYLEYVGLGKKSTTATQTKDCTSITSSLKVTQPADPYISETPSKTRSVGRTDSKFPVTVQSVRGKNYVISPFPTKVGEANNYCDSSTGDKNCRTYLNNNDYPLGWTSVNAPTKLPVVQYTSPFKKFVGRYFDGMHPGFGGESWYQLKPTNASSLVYVPSKKKIYMNENANIVAYNADTFFSRVESELLKFFFRTYQGQYYESAISWDAYFYPYESGWSRNSVDHGSTVVTGFDADDRGYIYVNGWDGLGVARDNGTTITPVMQIVGDNVTDTTLKAKSGAINTLVKLPAGTEIGGPYQTINSFKSGGKYYVMSSVGGTKGGYSVFDFTDPLKPTFVSSVVTGGHFQNIVKFSGVNDDIIIGQSPNGGANSIKIYKGSDLVVGGGPSKEFVRADSSIPGSSEECRGYYNVAVDSVSGNIYSIGCERENSSSGKYLLKLSIMTPSVASDPTSYTEVRHDLGIDLWRGGSSANQFRPDKLSYSNGYLASVGTVALPAPTRDIKLWIIKDKKPVELNTNNFIAKHYGRAPEGYASSMGSTYDMSLFSYGGKDYLFHSSQYTADIYELEPTDRDLSVAPDMPITGIPDLTIPDLGAFVPFTSCEDSAGDDVLDLSLCQQIFKVQMKSCQYIPALPFCGAGKTEKQQKQAF